MLGLKCSPLNFLQVQTCAKLYLYVCANLNARKPSCVMVVLLLHVRLHCSLMGSVVEPEQGEWLSARSKVSVSWKTKEYGKHCFPLPLG